MTEGRPKGASTGRLLLDQLSRLTATRRGRSVGTQPEAAVGQ